MENYCANFLVSSATCTNFATALPNMPADQATDKTDKPVDKPTDKPTKKTTGKIAQDSKDSKGRERRGGKS
jgi:hypothetical protein